MNHYHNSLNRADSNEFSGNQIRALSNGIGIGQTRQRKLNLFSHPTPSAQPSVHQTGYGRVIQEQSVEFRQKASFLYSINRFFMAVVVDIVVLSSILGFGAFVAFLALDGSHDFSFAAMKISLLDFGTAAKSLTSTLKMIEVVLVPSTILLIYYLALTLLLGNTVGFSLLRKKKDRPISHD